MENPLRNGFRVGEWDIQPNEGQIIGPDGAVHLEPKVMDVLVCLASNAGRVTGRDAIIAEVWGHTVISDEPLTRCIAALRRLLGDDPQKPRYIQTVPKRGYRLVAEVQGGRAARPGGAERSWSAAGLVALLAVLVVAIALSGAFLYRSSVRVPDAQSGVVVDGRVDADVRSIVVLPFDVTDPDIDLPNFGRTFSADLVKLLSKVDGLQAKSMLYVDNLMKSGMNPVEIGSELAASHVLQGLVESDADTVRLTLELIDAENGDVAWTRSFNEDITGLIRLQYNVVDNIAVSVGVVPLAYGDEGVRDVDPRAYRLYVEARGITDPSRADEIAGALAEAIQYDPEFAAAHSLLALHYMIRGWASEDRFGPFLDTAVHHAMTATQLDPNLVEPQLILANIHALRYEWVAAREALDAATGSSPDALPAAPIVINFGNVQQAIEISRQLHADNPYGDGLTFQTVYYSIAGEFDRALQAAEIARIHGKMSDISRLGVYYAKTGDVDTATEMFAQFLPIWRLDSALAQPYADSIAAGVVTDEFQQALDAADAALDANSIFFHVYIGSPADTVFELANRLYDERRLNIIALYEPWAREYRDDPRFVDLVDKMGLLDYWRRYGPPDFCSFDREELDCG